MDVGEIISFSEWTPGKFYDDNTPVISVLLPTYSRGKNGMFLRAAKSVLSQTKKDIELIIVDDASTDGTADQISELMSSDGRVSLVHHPRNVGLPAISVYEAFIKAKGDYIAFAFDDTEFSSNALNLLWSHANQKNDKILYGHVNMMVHDEVTKEQTVVLLGKGYVSQSTLYSHNYVPNNAILMHRDVIQKVGWYDPHICMARLCDWDLWVRVAKEFKFNAVDVPVGWEYGPSTNDSLGKTRLIDMWMTNEWMSLPRNELLKPENYDRYDVLSVPENMSSRSKQVIREMESQYKDKFWYKKSYNVPWEMNKENIDNDGCLLIVCPLHDASVSLYFEYFPDSISKKIRIIQYSAWAPCPDEMINASAVIFVRALFDYSSWIDIANSLNIPCYYFIDDNFIVLREEGNREYDGYIVEDVRIILKKFSGILLSTHELIKYYQAHELHQNLIYYPPMTKQLQTYSREQESKNEIRIGFLGGPHRSENFKNYIFPAIQMLAMNWKIKLFVPAIEDWEVSEAGENLLIERVPRDISYDLVIRTYRGFNLDILVHANGNTNNNVYKTQNVLINAVLLGATPILSDAAPYSGLNEKQVAVLCKDSIEAWYFGLEEIIKAPEKGIVIRERLSQYCQEFFSGKDNCTVIKNILKSHPVPGIVLKDMRYKNLLRMSASIPKPSRNMKWYLKEALFMLKSGQFRILHAKIKKVIKRKF